MDPKSCEVETDVLAVLTIGIIPPDISEWILQDDEASDYWIDRAEEGFAALAEEGYAVVKLPPGVKIEHCTELVWTTGFASHDRGT